MLPDNAYYWNIVSELDNADIPLTDWEVDFVESIMDQGRFTPKQKDVLDRMKEKYLG